LTPLAYLTIPGIKKIYKDKTKPPARRHGKISFYYLDNLGLVYEL
jgi:hypothetical protein